MGRSPSGSAGGPPASGPRGWHHRGYLPHFDAGEVAQMTTYRLADSLPRGVLAELPPMPDNAKRCRCDALLDTGIGSCLLARPAAASVVVMNWRQFDGVRYRLHAWVVMPNHVHLVATIAAGQSLSRIVQAWKSYTAHRLAVLTDTPGRIWFPDYWDRFIRDDAHFVAAAEYVEDDPLRAGLVAVRQAWPWSSASALQCGRAARAPG